MWWDYIIVGFVSATIGAVIGYAVAALMVANDERKDK
jgi:hypothetical protein